MKWIYIILIIGLIGTAAAGIGYFTYDSLSIGEGKQSLSINSSASLIEGEQDSVYTYFNEFDKVKFLFYKDGSVKVLDDLNVVKGEFSFAVTGDNMTHNSYEYSWDWTYKEDVEIDENKNETPIYVLTGDNQDSFSWVQEWKFYDNKSMKIKNTITNNLGDTIENTKVWYVDTLEEGSTVNYNGESYELKKDMEALFFTEGIDDVQPDIDTGFIEFTYADLVNDTVPVTDFYVGSGDVIGRNETYITALGLTIGTFKDGESFIFDPEVTAYKTPTVTGTPLNQWTNGDRVKVSDNSRATETTVGESLDTSNYTFSVPAGATIVGIEVAVEGYGGTCSE